MANFSLDTFRAQLQRPARGHLFRCQITPNGLLTGVQFPQFFVQTRTSGKSLFSQSPDSWLLCRSIELPEIMVETGEISYFTRTIKYPGKRSFGPLILTFTNTVDYRIREAFELWNHLLHSPINNMGATFDVWSTHEKFGATMKDSAGTRPTQRPLDLTATIDVIHYDGVARPDGSLENAQPIYSYQFVQAFPTAIGPLSFSYDNDTEIQTFTVTFAYTHMVPTAQDATVAFAGPSQVFSDEI